MLAPAGPVGDLATLGAALLDGLPRDAAKPTGLETWERRAPPLPGAVVDLLIALSRIDAGLAMRGIKFLLTWPATYALDTVLVPAALVFAGTAESTAGPAIERLRDVCLDHLRARIALPLEAPRDWARPNPLKCDCADCRALEHFVFRRTHSRHVRYSCDTRHA